VYIMTNKNHSALYTGVSSDLERGVVERIQGEVKGFTSRYHLNRLVWFESYRDANDAIARKKTIKGWLRSKKLDLINSMNPDWKDLATDWFQNAAPRDSSLRSE
jgi:putative endonuclease